MGTSIDQAFHVMKRANFLPEELKSQADWDVPLPIGFGQTNSQPTTVHMMLEWLNPEDGDKILDVGSGSGWTTALLSCMVGSKGQIYAVEKISELCEFGKENCRKAGVINARFYEANKQLGLMDYAPYDRILVSASATELPKELIKQLKPNGRLVVPVLNSILVVDKTMAGYEVIEHPGFAFVPLET